MSRRRVVVWMEHASIDDDHLSALRLVRWLGQDPMIDIEVVSAHEGPLLAAFAESAPVLVLDDLNRWRVGRTLAVLNRSRAAQFAKGLRLRWWVSRRRSADLSVAVGDAAPQVAALPFAPRRLAVLSEDPRTIAHLNRTTPARVGPVISHKAHEATDVVMATPQLFDGRPSSASRRHLIEAADDDLVVGAVGPSTWWEAPEQFVLWVWAFRRHHPDLDVRFRWLTNASETDVWTLRHDLRIAGLDDVVVVNRPDFLDAVPLLDVVVLSGRRPSWTHLVTGARQCGVEVVATDDVVSPGDDPGLRVVAYLDLEQMVDAVADALRAPAPPPAKSAALPEPPFELLRALRS